MKINLKMKKYAKKEIEELKEKTREMGKYFSPNFLNSLVNISTVLSCVKMIPNFPFKKYFSKLEKSFEQVASFYRKINQYDLIGKDYHRPVLDFQFELYCIKDLSDLVKNYSHKKKNLDTLIEDLRVYDSNIQENIKTIRDTKDNEYFNVAIGADGSRRSLGN